MAEFNQDAVRLVKPYVEKTAEDAVAVFISNGATLPMAAAFVGKLFVKTGDDAGLYVATGTTTPGWKTVTHAS